MLSRICGATRRRPVTALPYIPAELIVPDPGLDYVAESASAFGSGTSCFIT